MSKSLDREAVGVVSGFQLHSHFSPCASCVNTTPQKWIGSVLCDRFLLLLFLHWCYFAYFPVCFYNRTCIKKQKTYCKYSKIHCLVDWCSRFSMTSKVFLTLILKLKGPFHPFSFIPPHPKHTQIIQEFHQKLFVQKNVVFQQATDFLFQPVDSDTVNMHEQSFISSLILKIN